MSYEVIPCDGQCFECPFPDCVVNRPFRTPFEIEQARIREKKDKEAKARAEEKAKSDVAFARWLRKNTGRGRRACRLKR